ncbi:MAG TPA: adenylate/guanylate cyclase domain-containing protein [Actinomycetota bacterium]|nr:adenylate/guanylate cyclase domain-containing protein [Actinomycetota bacterium]
MRGPFTPEQLAELAHIEVEELLGYVADGLLDLDGDGLLDEMDALRLRVIIHHKALGHPPAQIGRGLLEDTLPLLGPDLLVPERTAHLTLEEVGQRTGLTPEQITALRTASGTPGDLLTTTDVDVMAAVAGVVQAGVPWEAILEAARVYGDAMRRLAHTEVRILSAYMDDMERTYSDERDRSERLMQLARGLRPVIDSLLVHLHQRHLLRALAEDNLNRLEAKGPRTGERPATILFVDLASFTPLAQVHGDEVAADVLNRFDNLVRELVVPHEGAIVKQIGDAFMLTFREPVSALRFAIELDVAIGREWHFPAIRVGVHTGEVLYRVGDYVGNTVNIAARVAALAQASEILITKPVAAAALEADIPVEPAGERDLRGLTDPLPVYRVVRTGGRASRREQDPVCGMLVGTHSAARLLHGGYEFVFCSEECLRRFLAAPARYAMPPADAKPIL